MSVSALDLKKTVNLPKTDFPMKANLPQAEPKMLERWEAENLYQQIREARAGHARSTSCTTARRTPTATFTWARRSIRS